MRVTIIGHTEFLHNTAVKLRTVGHEIVYSLDAHGGDLPRYRSNACQAGFIINGDDRVGLCIHRMIGHELDSVDIVPRSCLPLDLKTKLGEVVAWLGRETKVLFVDAPLRLQADPAYMLERQSKDPQDALRCYPRRPEDSRIDWSVAAIDVLLLFNVSNKHYAGAFCGYEGRPLIIWEAETIDDGERFCARPGQITAIAEQTVDLACGLGKLRIRQVKLDAEPMSAARCITSIRKRLM